jgi:hypothetical protein
VVFSSFLTLRWIKLRKKSKIYNEIAYIFGDSFHFKKEEMIEKTLSSLSEKENIVLEEITNKYKYVQLGLVIMNVFSREDITKYNQEDIKKLSKLIYIDSERLKVLDRLDRAKNDKKLTIGSINTRIKQI